MSINALEVSRMLVADKKNNVPVTRTDDIIHGDKWLNEALENIAHWIGTKEEYEAQKETIPAGTTVIITDDYSEAGTQHNDLIGRSAANAHPISAITGLQNALDGKADSSVVNYVTPEMFGAKGDGETDDTVAFQSAVQGYNRVYLTKGKKYKLKSTIIVPVGCEIFGGGVKSEVIIDHIYSGFEFVDGYRGNYVHDFAIRGGSMASYAFKVARPLCKFESITLDEYSGDGFTVINGSVTGGYAVWFDYIHFTGKKVENLARKIAFNVDVNGGLVNIDNSNIAMCSTAIQVLNCDGIFISNSNISECNAAKIPTSQGEANYGFKLTGGNTFVVDKCYLENCNVLLDSRGNGTKNIVIKNSFINLLAQSVNGIILVTGKNFAMNNCTFISQYSGACAVSIDNKFEGLINLMGNVFEVNEIYRGNSDGVLYNDDNHIYYNSYVGRLREIITSLNENTTINKEGTYICNGNIEVNFELSSLNRTGKTADFYSNTGTTTITVPSAINETRTYKLTAGTGCKVIKGLTGYYNVLGADVFDDTPVITNLTENTVISRKGIYITSGNISVSFEINSLKKAGDTVEIYSNNGTVELTFPYAYGSSRTYTLSAGTGCKVIKGINGYYSALGAIPS